MEVENIGFERGSDTIRFAPRSGDMAHGHSHGGHGHSHGGKAKKNRKTTEDALEAGDAEHLCAEEHAGHDHDHHGHSHSRKVSNQRNHPATGDGNGAVKTHEQEEEKNKKKKKSGRE